MVICKKYSNGCKYYYTFKLRRDLDQNVHSGLNYHPKGPKAKVNVNFLFLGQFLHFFENKIKTPKRRILSINFLIIIEVFYLHLSLMLTLLFITCVCVSIFFKKEIVQIKFYHSLVIYHEDIF